MMYQKRTRRKKIVLLLTGAPILFAGCAHVNQDQLADEMDLLREEMRTQDDAVEERVMGRLNQMSDDLDGRIASLADELDALRGEFDITVERLESAVRFNAPVHFAFDEEAVRPEDRALLDRFAQVVSGYYQEATITIEGFTDPAGTPEYNLALGERRAEAVREYLESAGIPADRMRTVSYGEAPDRQIARDVQGPGEVGWENRRAALVIDFSGARDGPTVAVTN